MVALVTFLHGLRVSELIDLRWDDIDWRKGTIAIRRLKGSIDGTHYLERDEAIGLKRLQREQEPRRPHIFTSERGEAFSRFAINKMIATAGQNAKITWPVHPHCLRHTTGTMQANGGMDAWRLSEADGPRLDRQHHQIRQDEPGAVEGCLAGQTLEQPASRPAEHDWRAQSRRADRRRPGRAARQTTARTLFSGQRGNHDQHRHHADRSRRPILGYRQLDGHETQQRGPFANADEAEATARQIAADLSRTVSQRGSRRGRADGLIGDLHGRYRDRSLAHSKTTNSSRISHGSPTAR